MKRLLDSRQKRRLVLIISILAVICLNSFLLFSTYSLTLPSTLTQELKRSKVFIKSADIQSNLLPFPHLFVKDIKIDITDRVTLSLQKATFNFDLFKLIFSQQQIIESIEIHSAELHINEKKISIFDSKITLENVVNMIEHLINNIPTRLGLAQFVKVNEFQLYYDALSITNSLLTAKQVYLANLTSETGKLELNVAAFMGAWLVSDVKIDIWPKNIKETQSAFLVDKVDIYVNSQVDFQKLSHTFENIPEALSGRATLSQFISFKLPLKELSHSHLIQIPDLTLKYRKKPVIKINSKDNLRINFSGLADKTHVQSKNFSLALGKSKLTAEALWSLADFKLEWKFIKTKLRSKDILNVLKIPSHLKPPFSNENSYISLQNLVWLPWREVRYRFKSHISIAPESLTSAPPFLIGNVTGHNYFLKSKNLVAKNSKTLLPLKGFRFWLNPLKLKTKVTGHIYLEDFSTVAKGNVYLATNINCKFIKVNEMNCVKQYLYAKGKRLAIRAGAAARFYRFLSINLFSYWKSLKPNSEIIFKQTELQGYLNKNSIEITQTVLNSDIGDFDFRGDWQPFSGTGQFKLGLTPLNVDKVLSPIPLVGKALNESIAFAAQMIFTLSLKENQMKLESFTLGKGLDKFKSLINRSD